MNFWLLLAIAGALFVAGVRLSAFFSGSETGFYRVSFLRLSIDAHTGDTVARRLLWFVQHPELFVATTLVGNNIANYVTTIAIGLGTGLATEASSTAVEVGATLLIAPVIFVFGELMPKNLYFRAPTTLLRKNVGLFQFFYRSLLPASMPLVWITRTIEKFSSSPSSNADFLLGRHRLIQVLSKGHEHGVLTNQQGILVHGLLHDATRPISEIMIPAARILGEDENASRSTLLEYARTNHLTHIPVKRHNSAGDWFGYVRVLDLELGSRTDEEMIRTMPRIPFDATRLMALLAIRDSGESVGVITDGDEVLGLIMENVLIDHLMHPLGAPGTRTTTPQATKASPTPTESSA
ncbi:MAG: CNNM domain-containing protein [Planctomycetota bacterium]|nr:CNNM domain-containing protein [Planctomycetota bacterium]MDA0920962.1 CNNM domain-containing protein [Planctomycetota bacterium]MDA1159409.1 CNNM domain-containing protein [Planctomycetota bacterium]